MLDIVSRLSGGSAPRVLTSPQLGRLLSPGRSQRTHARQIERLIDAGLLQPVRRGLFVNRLAQPPVMPDEVAAYLRPGAVVSLHRVLGEAGVANNPSRIVTAILPLQSGLPLPKAGPVETAIGAFHFRVVPDWLAFAGREQDRLDLTRRYPCATPEKALIDWIYLGASPRSDLPPPPLDMDVDLLDARRLNRLARAADMEGAVQDWLEANVLDLSDEESQWLGPAP